MGGGAGRKEGRTRRNWRKDGGAAGKRERRGGNLTYLQSIHPIHLLVLRLRVQDQWLLLGRREDLKLAGSGAQAHGTQKYLHDSASLLIE